jgi:hypothetical protein
MLNAPFQLFDQVQSQLGSGNLFVEIGTARGSGSTPYFYNYSANTGNDFVTVDIYPIALPPAIKRATMSGETWVRAQLPNLNKQISLAFLDGFDWTIDPVAVRNGTAGSDVYNLIKQYASSGLVLNNLNSSMSHMIQVLGMLPYFASKAAIMFTDTWFNYQLDTFEGKGAGAIYLLLAEGFQIISASYKLNYVMLGKNVMGTVNMPNLDQTTLNKIRTGQPIPPNQVIYIND